MKTKMTMDDMIDHVVYKCYCSWELFMENVLEAGMSRQWLVNAVSECETERDLHKLANKFI